MSRSGSQESKTWGRLPLAGCLPGRLSEGSPTLALMKKAREGRLQEAGHEKADSKKPAPTKQSRLHPRSLHPPNGDVTGCGYSKACHPRIPEHTWHSAPYGVAMTRPARHCCHADPDATHDGLSARPTGGGPLRAERHPKAAWPPPVGPRRGRLPAAGSLPPSKKTPH